MMGSAGDASPPDRGELREGRCPNCGASLRFEPGRAEGFCSNEGVYVEVARPADRAPTRPPLVRSEVLAAGKPELQQLCRAYGLPVSGNKTDLLMRITRYMDELQLDLPLEELEEVASDSDETLEASILPPPSDPSGHAEVDLLLEEVDGVDVVEETPAEFDDSGRAPVIDSSEHDAPALEDATLGGRSDDDRPRDGLKVSRSRLRRDRIAFYVGSLLLSAGVVGLLLGAILHDALRVPVIGTAYEAFGPLNQLATGLGFAFLVPGLLAIGFGLRGGIVRATPAEA